MLDLVIPDKKMFNEKAKGNKDDPQFYIIPGRTLRLEHSLVSLAKWEAEWEKPFLLKEPKTRKQTISYIKHMTVTQNVDPEVYNLIGNDLIDIVNDYINKSMSATTFRKDQRPLTQREIITAEIIYYWMILFNIPSEYQKWHLNRLLTLINVCNLKTKMQEKMSRKDALAQQRAINNARRAKTGSKG